jgi:hypothetical protein
MSEELKITKSKEPVSPSSGDEAGTPTAMGKMTSQFLQGDFAAVVGGAKAGSSKHAGAPDGGQGGGNVPTGSVLGGHIDAGSDASKARGNSPQRSAGRKTQAGDIDKLKTAGS